ALPAARYVAANDTRVLVAGTPEFYDYFEAQNGRKRYVVDARDGETLGALGKRYGMSLGSVERVNHRSRTDQLAAGESVVVYADKGHAPPPRKFEPEPAHAPEPVLSDAALASDARAEEPADSAAVTQEHAN